MARFVGTEPLNTVFVVEQDDGLRADLRDCLSKHGFAVRDFQSAESFLDSLPAAGPACVVVDQHLPGLSGPELQRKLLGNPAVAIVFVTGSGDVPTVVEAMKHGAVDFLAKPIQEAHLVAAVTRGLQDVVRAEAQRHARAAFLERVQRLTTREREVAVCLIAGLSNKQIAADLGMTEKTAKVHRSHVMAKLEVGSVVELIRLAEATRPSPILPSSTAGDIGSHVERAPRNVVDEV